MNANQNQKSYEGFEALIREHQVFSGLTVSGLEAAREYLLQWHAEVFPKSKPGSLLRAKKIGTLLGFAHNLRSGGAK